MDPGGKDLPHPLATPSIPLSHISPSTVTRLNKLIPAITKVCSSPVANVVALSSALLDQPFLHVGRSSKVLQKPRTGAKFHQGRPLAAARSPCIIPISIGLWNNRSLYKIKDNKHDTLHTACNIISAHTLTVLVENRSTYDLTSVHASAFPTTHQHIFSHHNTHTAGISIHISFSFLRSCSSYSTFSPFPGYALILQCDSLNGSLDFVALYLDSRTPTHRIRILHAVLPYIRKHAHTILIGDMNFVEQSGDRMDLDGSLSQLHSGSDTKFFQKHFGNFQEFEQPLFTCRNSHGLSRIDRIYTSLSPLLFNLLGTACNLNPISAALSDHFFLSAKFFELSSSNSIPSWVSKGKAFGEFAKEELKLDATKLDDGDPLKEISSKLGDPLEALLAVQEVFRSAAGYVRKDTKGKAPESTRHKLVIVSSFMRALVNGNVECAMQIRSRYSKLAGVDVHNWSGSHAFLEVQAHYTELIQREAQERREREAQQEQQQSQSQDVPEQAGWLEFGGLGSSYSAVYKLKPGGHCSISAVELPPTFSPPPPSPSPLPSLLPPRSPWNPQSHNPQQTQKRSHKSIATSGSPLSTNHR